MGVTVGPARARECPEGAEGSQANNHNENETQLLDHFAGVLEGVDEKTEDRTREDGEERLIEQLRQRTQTKEDGGEVHEGDQGEAAKSAPEEAVPRALFAALFAHSP